MIHIPYQNMKPGEIYMFYRKMDDGKILGLFQLTDSQPIMDSFSIILISHAMMLRTGGIIKERNNYASSLSPSSDNIYQLSPDEFNAHIVIPEL